MKKQNLLAITAASVLVLDIAAVSTLPEDDRFLTAVTAGNTNTVQALLATQEGHDAVNSYRDETGATLLHRALEQKNDALVRLLIDAGASLEAQDAWQETPLHTAAEHGHNEGARLLTAAGSDPNALNESNETPLHKAALRGHEQTVQILLDSGAEPDVQDNWPKTAFQHGVNGLTNAESEQEEAQFRNILRLLIQKGALISEIDSLLENIGEGELRTELRRMRNEQLETARQILIDTYGLSQDACSTILRQVGQKTPAMIE